MQILASLLVLFLSFNGAYTPEDCAPDHPKGMNGPTEPK